MSPTPELAERIRWFIRLRWFAVAGIVIATSVVASLHLAVSWPHLMGLAALASFAAQAQPVYRIVGPDGRVTFSDRPPADGSKTQPGRGGDAPAAGPGLPFELRSAAGRYPVTLYTGANCAPCSSGRN